MNATIKQIAKSSNKNNCVNKLNQKDNLKYPQKNLPSKLKTKTIYSVSSFVLLPS